MEAELIKMEKLATVGQMVITVNHEINNPLVIISTNAQSLRLLNKDLDEKSKPTLELSRSMRRFSTPSARQPSSRELIAYCLLTRSQSRPDVSRLAATGT